MTKRAMAKTKLSPVRASATWGGAEEVGFARVNAG